MASNMDKLAKELKKEMSASDGRKPKPYDTQAEVLRVEDGTAWVHIPGGVEETPVRLTIDAKKGDTVNVHVGNGTAWITGNSTRPPTDDTTAISAKSDASRAMSVGEMALNAANDAENEAQRAKVAADSAEASAQSAATSASNAMTAAQSAQASADSALVSLANVEDVVGVLEWITAHGTMTLTSDVAINPAHVYFIVDPAGDYEVGGTHYSIVSEPKVADIGTYYELSIDKSVQNYIATHLVVNSEGLWLIPDSGGNKVLIATGAGSSYTVAGTYIIGKVNGIDTVFAKFTTSGVTMNANNNTQIAHLGYGPSSGVTGVVDAPYYTLGTRKTTTTPYNSASTYEVGDLCIYNGNMYCCKTSITTAEAWDSTHWNLANGTYSLVEGFNNIAAYYNAHAEGQGTIALGSRSHAEGGGTIASGADSHAEGLDTIASGSESHAEGHQTKATNIASHAEGSGTKATGIYGSHAEGFATQATAYSAHSEGSYTIASGEQSHAEGWYSKATASHAHSEGYWCEANGMESHAQNTSTIANGASQTTLGKFNVADTTSAVIIGNGTSSSVRSNALTVDWSGNVNIPSGAKYKINGTALSASDITNAVSTSDVTTSGEVNKIPKIKSDGVLELRKYIDLHDTSSTQDYDVRIACGATTGSSGGAPINFTCGDFKINSNSLIDFVVEEDSSVTWYYRKWKSGKVECWKKYDAGTQTPSQWVTGWYYKDIVVGIPVDIFSSAPTIVNATIIGSDYQYMVFSAVPVDATSIRVRVVKPNSGAANPIISVYATNML